MNNMPDTSSMTLESIALQKKELRKKIHAQKEIMTDTARELFAPLAPAADKGNAIMRAFNTGMAVFDGLMLGVKMMKPGGCSLPKDKQILKQKSCTL